MAGVDYVSPGGSERLSEPEGAFVDEEMQLSQIGGHCELVECLVNS